MYAEQVEVATAVVLALVGWLAVSAGLAGIVGRSIHLRDRHAAVAGRPRSR